MKVNSMVKMTNNFNIDLPLAVWLLQDGYKSGASDAPPGELLSATTLMKPIRQLILKRKVDQTQETMDVSDLIASRMGHSLHDGIERAWTEGNWRAALKRLHYPESIINKFKINPDPDKLEPDDIPVYLEKRGFKEFGGIVVTGQMDFLIGTAYRDFKSTSTFAWTSGSKDKDYILQGSLYRWIMPDLIKDDVMRIEFIFTDWVKYMAKANPNYPQKKVAHREFALMSLDETEAWVVKRLKDIRKNAKLPQSQMVRCTAEELWRQKDAFKYYTDPEKAKLGGRCTKRFDNLADGQLHLKEKGKGTLVTVPGEVKACPFCPAFSVCEQRKEYFDDDENYIET
jgi:hypothetical protein